jgi:prolyl-tRNA synthetase
MSHGDDDGLIMPPRLAPVQVQIIPIFKDEQGKALLQEFCDKLVSSLKAKQIRVEADFSDNRPPDKMWKSIKKGVPIRVEIGAREMEQNSLTFVMRDLGKDSKETVNIEEFINRAPQLLNDLHDRLYERSKTRTLQNIFDVKNAAEIKEFYASGKTGFVRLPVSQMMNDDVIAVQKEFSLSNRCIPFSSNGEFVLIGKSY